MGGQDPEPGQLGAEHLQPLSEGPELGGHCHLDWSPSLRLGSQGWPGPAGPQSWTGLSAGGSVLRGLEASRSSAWERPHPRRVQELTVGGPRSPPACDEPAEPPSCSPGDFLSCLRAAGPRVSSAALALPAAPGLTDTWAQCRPHRPSGSAPRQGQSCTEQRPALAGAPSHRQPAWDTQDRPALWGVEGLGDTAAGLPESPASSWTRSR